MKHKTKIFNIGRNTYFHHRYGAIKHKKYSSLVALYASTLLVLGGGFFITSNIAIPLIKKNIKSLQSTQPVSVNPIFLAESEPADNNLPEIKQENEALKVLLEEKLASFPKDQKWAIFMYDLKTGQQVSINSDEVFASASLYKFFLLEALESKLPFESWQYTWLSDGTQVSTCVEQMLSKADNACAEHLGEYVGWDYIQQLNQKNGYVHTTVFGPEGRKSSAADVGEFLVRLKKGQILSDKARRLVFDVLYQQTNSKGITLGCEGCRVADKLGEASGIVHDAGIVTHGSESYALIIMSEGGNFKQIKDLTQNIEENR